MIGVVGSGSRYRKFKGDIEAKTSRITIDGFMAFLIEGSGEKKT